ncbi:hybrid sensor histidine kinase/response regulator, partial [Pelomonas sp. KK5]|uniref:hybrid sensor histidine kinase/response regulator n=1 Tax=Pelomonas sp. KK5 TaxID=1855730 RepID=UPI00117DF9F3
MPPADPLPEQGAVDQELLRLLARQSRRVPWPVGFSALVIGAMAGHGAHIGFSLGWIACVFGMLLLRGWLIGRLPQMVEVSLQRRLRWAVAASALNGLVLSASLCFAPYLSDYERMLQTILLLGLCAGAIAATAGSARLLRPFLVPVSLANALSWVSGSGGAHAVSWLDWGLGAMILIFAFILSALAADAYRVFVDSVLIRQQQARRNQQLRLALKQAELANQAKTRFLAAASHDLRQPMQTLSLYGAALLRQPLDEKTAGIARRMNLAVQSLATQMDGLLDVSRLDAGAVPVHSQVFALCPWLAGICQEVRPQALAKGLRLTLDCSAAAFVDTDHHLLGRLLRNLLDNALKYTARGEVAVSVRRDGEVWRVRVRDTGCGIAPHEQGRVFEEFYQVDNPERDRARGLGLGLSICSRLADLLDLSLGLESMPGEGSTFSLGLAAAEAPGNDSTPGESAAALLPERALAGLRVLVLDNEAPVREAMQALLQAHGCSVTAVATLREALLLSLAQRPDLLLADLQLGGGDDGIAAVRS